MKKIVPVTIPLFGTLDTINVDVLPFQLQPGESYGVQVYYRVSGENAKDITGNMPIPSEVVDVWNDDSVVIEYVANQLELTLETEE